MVVLFCNGFYTASSQRLSRDKKLPGAMLGKDSSDDFHQAAQRSFQDPCMIESTPEKHFSIMPEGKPTKQLLSPKLHIGGSMS